MSRRAALVLLASGVRADESQWRARVTGSQEPGEPLIITGRVLRANDKSPVSGAVITMYQTDAAGIYGKGQGHPSTISRLRGKLTTGANGEYEIVTIRPGHYPGGGVPAHIHAAITPPNGTKRELPEILFAGDKYITGREKAVVLDVRKDRAGIWRVTHDILLPE